VVAYVIKSLPVCVCCTVWKQTGTLYGTVLQVVYHVRDLESVVTTSGLDRRSFLRLLVARQIIWPPESSGSVFSGALLVSSTSDGHPEFIPSGCFRHAIVAKHLAGQVKDIGKNRN
jgi:hypothetical protein